MVRKSLLVGTALRSAAFVGLLAVAHPAAAQDMGDQDDTTASAQDQTEEEEPAIIITGSRLKTVTPYNSPDPIAVIDPTIAMQEGKFDTASMLQSSPIASGSTQITSALSSNFVTNGGPGSQTIDLRGLGANRTLVLLNGRRAGPAGTRGGVSSFDLNVLPLSIINDVQILKTGASSIYGSDAVAGVVNISTNTKMDGFSLNLNSSVPTEGGGESYRISGAWGKVFSRGHITVAGDYSHTNELARGDRDYLACPEAYIFDQSGNRADLVDPRTGSYHCEDLRWGHIWTYDLIDNLYLDGPGGPNTGAYTVAGPSVLLQYQYHGENLGIPAFGPPAFQGDFYAPAGWYPTGYDTASMAVQNAYHPFVEQQTIIPKTDLYTAYAEGAYELSDSVELFGEFLFNRRETYQNGWRQFWNFGYTGDFYGSGAGNYFNYWGDGFGGLNLISPTAITDHSDSSQTVDYYRGVGGVRGDFNFFGGRQWHYEAYAQYSRSIGTYRTEQILQDAYDVGYDQGFGVRGSCVGTTLPVSGKACVDIPWTDPYFLRGEITPEQANMLFDWEEGRTVYKQITGEASISGELFDLPGGPVGLALGVTARQDKIVDTPGAITLAGNAWGTSTGGITAGKSLTTEAFGELSLPILKDIPAIQELTISLAGRLTNVKATRASDGVSDSSKGNWTYKIGANWAITDWFRLRGSWGTSYRAPALFEQFLADQTSFVAQRIDPCIRYTSALAAGRISQRTATNCAADGIPGTYTGGAITATAHTSGGLGILEPETSRAFVVGGVLTPKFFGSSTRLSLAVDYFDIKVNGEIAQLGAGTIVAGCYDSENFASEPLCNLFTRSTVAGTTEFNLLDIYDQYINISSQRNRGIDVSFLGRQDLGRFGSISLSADVTWQLEDNIKLLPTSTPQSDNGEPGSPKWVGDFRATWLPMDGTTVFYGVNVIGPTSKADDFFDDYGSYCLTSTNTANGQNLPIYGTYCPKLDTPAVFYHNVSLTQSVAEKFTLTLGVNNLFNTRPPRVSVLNGGEISTLGPVIAASQYPFVGRRVFVNVSAEF